MSIPKKRRPKTGRRTARRQFSCCKKIRPPPADRCSPNHVTEAASEFTPPHIYTKVACTAKRNFDHECKKTFATKSALKRPSARPCPDLEHRSVRNTCHASARAPRPRLPRAWASNVDVERRCGALHNFPGDHHLLDAFEARQVEHGVEQDALHDRAQPPRAGLAVDRLAGDGAQLVEVLKGDQHGQPPIGSTGCMDIRHRCSQRTRHSRPVQKPALVTEIIP